MTLTKSILRVALGTGLLLLIPVAAKLFLPGMAWSVGDFVAAGILLFGAGLTFVLIARMGDNTAYKLAAGVAVAAGLLLVWANLAVGLVGSEDNPANLLYGGVLGVALIGAIVARFRPLGMSNAMFAAALTYVVVTAIALFVWKPTGAAAEPSVHMLNVVGANAVFAAIWVVSGWLFRRASGSSSNLTQRLA
jgi:predicted lysophospholipase L1 biosynthesis ABC-type transport system permease subunit